MTYREAIQSQVKKLQEVYDNAEHLRDAANTDEELYWNDVRTITADALLRLKRLDKRLKPDRAQLKLKGSY